MALFPAFAEVSEDKVEDSSKGGNSLIRVTRVLRFSAFELTSFCLYLKENQAHPLRLNICNGL